MTDQKYDHGKFVWRELMTTDLEASRRFYGELVGWKIEKAATVPGMDYWECSADGRKVAGMFAMAHAGMPANWSSYVSVPDVEAAVAAARAHGGKVLNGPMTVPNVGTMAAIMDPQGAYFSVFKDVKGDPMTEGQPGAGTFCWEQLNTTDQAGAKAFYAAVLGWKVHDFMGMETLGPREGPNGGAASVMDTQPGQPSNWLTFVVAGTLTDANHRATRLGGKVLMDRIDVPHVGSFSVIADNVGAVIALFGPTPT